MMIDVWWLVLGALSAAVFIAIVVVAVLLLGRRNRE
jgi:hypothetical protein